MDGQVQEQEINDMFAKFTAAFDYIRQTFVNASVFAEQVKALQAQVTQLSQDFESLKAHNGALDEALRTAYSERDSARAESNDWQVKYNSAETARAQAQTDADHWYNQHTEVSNKLVVVTGERSARENDLREALDENASLKSELERITAQLTQIYQGLQPKPVVEPVPTHEGEQPRDPATQQWRSWQEAQSA